MVENLNSERVERITKEKLEPVMAEVLKSDEFHGEIQTSVSLAVNEYLSSPEFQSVLASQVKDAVEACLREVTGQLFQRFKG